MTPSTDVSELKHGDSSIGSDEDRDAGRSINGSVKSRGDWRGILRQFAKNRGAVIGLVVLLALVLGAALAPVISPYDPLEVTPGDRFLSPSLSHPLGTDVFGRDMLTRLLFGGRISLALGFIAVGIGVSVGVTLGLLGGYFGGGVDRFVSYLIDILLGFPGILLALTISASLGPGLFNAMVAVGIASLPQYMRVSRGTVLSIKENTYISAAKAIGSSQARIIVRHILPNIAAPLIVLASLGVGRAIIVGAAISFLGLGAQPPTPEWGAMLSGGRNYLRSAWWVTTFPGLFIMLTVMSWNMIGDGLRYALDPRFTE